MAPIMAAQAVETSVYASSSITSQNSSGGSGVPPSEAGVFSQNRPSERSVATASGGRVRSDSASSPAAAKAARWRWIPVSSSARSPPAAEAAEGARVQVRPAVSLPPRPADGAQA
jgi:hypothetical protein